MTFKYDILVVDDNFDITNIIKILLQKDGFRVFDFNDPILALEYFKLDPKKFALVITDVRMPGMSGIELLSRIKEVCPGIKSFLITAFELDSIEPEIKKHALEISEIFQKPIPLQNLSKSVNKYIRITESEKGKEIE
ncbi:MAG: response regulator [Nitrosopumilus sp.]|nr:response regulator [Nitrosopumilus sp.]